MACYAITLRHPGVESAGTCTTALGYFGGLALAALIAGYHYTLIRDRERDGCFRAFPPQQLVRRGGFRRHRRRTQPAALARPVKALLAALLLATACAACTPVNIHYNAAKAHHRPDGFVNTDVTAKVGGIPWYEILFRNLRGDFRPLAPPAGGYDAFAAKWTAPVDHALLARRTDERRASPGWAMPRCCCRSAGRTS
jgi:hypothetical protein